MTCLSKLSSLSSRIVCLSWRFFLLFKTFVSNTWCNFVLYEDAYLNVYSYLLLAIQNNPIAAAEWQLYIIIRLSCLILNVNVSNQGTKGDLEMFTIDHSLCLPAVPVVFTLHSSAEVSVLVVNFDWLFGLQELRVLAEVCVRPEWSGGAGLPWWTSLFQDHFWYAACQSTSPLKWDTDATCKSFLDVYWWCAESLDCLKVL